MNTFTANLLTGGIPGALDVIDGNDLNDGDACIVTLSTGVYFYHLNATGGAVENSPYVIVPDTNPGTKNWELVVPVGPMSHVSATETTGQSIPDGTNTLIVFNSKSKDTLSEFNTTTGVFTATYDGRYIVNSKVKLASATYTDIRLFIYKNTSTLIKRGIEFSAGTITSSIFAVIDLVATDTIQINILQTSGGARVITTGDDSNWLTIDRIA